MIFWIKLKQEILACLIFVNIAGIIPDLKFIYAPIKSSSISNIGLFIDGLSGFLISYFISSIYYEYKLLIVYNILSASVTSYIS